MILLLKYWRVGLAAALLIAAFGSGWTVRSWRCDSAMAKVQAELQEARDKQRAKGDAAAGDNEISRAAVDRQKYATNTVIRETFREIPVPMECAAPSPVSNSLRAAARATNDAIAGLTPPALPADPVAP